MTESVPHTTITFVDIVDGKQLVLIDPIHLAKLTKMEAKARAKTENDLKRLNDYKQKHPEKAAEYSKRYLDKNREAYNARQRELRKIRKEKKLAEKAIATRIGTPLLPTTT